MNTGPGSFLARAVAALVLASTAAVIATVPAVAHVGGPEEGLLVGGHVDPGQSFQLLASFIEADVDVPITVRTGSSAFDLGSVHVRPDGTFDVMLTLPSDVPLGYAELHLAQPSQGDAATTFLVGPRDAVAGGATSGGSFLDSRVGALLVFGLTLAGIVVVGVLLVRGRSTRRT